MASKSFEIYSEITIGGEHKPLLIAGPCVIENESMILRHAGMIAEIAADLDMPLVFKTSYEKANRTSNKYYRGTGLDEGVRILARVRDELDIPVLTDAHSVTEILSVGDVADVIQIPAFLCRQTDLLVAAAKSGKTVNIKKGQFLAPEDVGNIVEKLTSSGGDKIMITERGSSFGYHKLVVDFTGLVKMREYGYPVVFDATHSVQSPGGLEGRSGGEGEYAKFLAWAAAGVGVDALFIEVHENPQEALSDGPNMISLAELKDVLTRFLSIAERGGRDITTF